MVLMAMSPDRSRMSRHDLPSGPPDVGTLLRSSVKNAAAHLGRRLARERDREDVCGIDAAAQEIEVAIDEHVRLAGAGRRLEHDVVRGIDGPRSRGVRSSIVDRPSSTSASMDPWTMDDRPIERQPVRRRQRSPSGTPRRARQRVHMIVSAGVGGNSPRSIRSTASSRRVCASSSVASLFFPRASIGTNWRSCPKAM